jgi:hypothetical protein
MAWEIDIVLVSKATSLDLDDLVPDVMRRRKKLLSFEEATLARRARPAQLSAAKYLSWGIVIDVPCKLVGFQSYAKEISIAREVQFIHIGQTPSLASWEGGVEREHLKSLEACRSYLLKNNHTCTDESDGELIAWDLANQFFKSNLFEKIYILTFTLFSL